MAVIIGHASGDERGKLRGGKAGEQNGREVYTRNWYNRPWTYVIEFIDPEMAEKAAYCMERACANVNIGYNQDKRNTLLVEARKYGYDPGKVTKKVDTDCSALVALCCMYAGIPEEALKSGNNSAYTGNLRTLLKKTGKVRIYTDKKRLTSGNYNHRGAILLNEGHHVAIQLTDGPNVSPRIKKEDSKKETSGSIATSSPAGASTTTTVTTESIGEVTSEGLNIRSKAGTDNKVVGTLKKGDYVYITKEQDGWAYVNGEGWASLKFIKKYAIQTQKADSGKVIAKLLNARKAPVNGDVLKILKKGTKVKITKTFTVDGKIWGYDSVSRTWISLKYIQL